MKTKKLVTLMGGISLLLILLVMTLVPACAKPAPAPAPAPAPTPPAEAIEIKSVTMSSGASTGTYAMKELVARVNAQAKGELTINYLGGPEVIPMFDQPVALIDGVVDLAWLPEAYFMRRLPPVYAASLCEWKITEEREKGVTDFFRKVLAQLNIYYIGKATEPTGFYFLTKERVSQPEDLAGKKFPGGPSTVPAFRAVGATAVDMEDAEIYPAIERGVIDGDINPISTFVRRRLGEVAPYLLDHPFYHPHTGILFNAKSWNSLPPHLQKLIQDTWIAMEPELEAFSEKNNNKDREDLLAMGVEAVQFSPDVAKKFRDSLYDTHWQMVKDFEGITPEMYNELREVFIRK